MPSNAPDSRDDVVASHREAFANRADVAKEVVQWFRDAHPKLANLSLEAVYDLTLPITAGRYYSKFLSNIAQNSYDNPHFWAASQAEKDACAAAAQLRVAINRLQEHLTALKYEADRTLTAVITAIEKAPPLKLPSKPKGGRPGNRWFIHVAVNADEIEKILRVNGFPRASMASDSGPAPAVMANLILSELGLEVAPATIAREWRATNKAERGEDTDSGKTPTRFPPRAKQN